MFQKSKVLPARSNESIKVQACLKTESQYEFEIYYRTDNKHLAEMNGIILPTSASRERNMSLLFKVEANGVHPVMSIRDIRSEGMSKTVIWQIF